MSHLMTKPTKWVCAQRRLRSAWASAQSDQSLRCPHEETLGSLATHWAHSEDSDQPGHPTSLIRCPGWSVYTGRTLILFVLSCRGSYIECIDEPSCPSEAHLHTSHVMRKPLFAICEQQRRRSACASAQSLISAFVIRCLDSIIPLFSISKISSL